MPLFLETLESKYIFLDENIFLYILCFETRLWTLAGDETKSYVKLGRTSLLASG